MAVHVAAGAVLLQRFGTALELEYKSEKDVVTISDKEAQEVIMNTIKAEFPHDDFFVEEAASHEYSDGRMWVIDPLDGTINFSRGIPLFGVSIAFVEKGVRKCGVIFLPYFDELYWAKRGGGAFCNDTPLRVSETERLAKTVIALNDYNIGPPERMRNLNLLKRELDHRLQGECMRIKNLGSASVELAYVASGRLDAYVMLFTYYWDIAAGTLIIEEAGGRATDYHGDSLGFDPKCVIVSNHVLHAEFLRLLSKGNNSLQARFESMISI